MKTYIINTIETHCYEVTASDEKEAKDRFDNGSFDSEELCSQEISDIVEEMEIGEEEDDHYTEDDDTIVTDSFIEEEEGTELQ